MGCAAMHCNTGVPSLLTLPWVGNGRAEICSWARIWAGVNDGCAASINATVPVTSGAEKLVPSEALKLSV